MNSDDKIFDDENYVCWRSIPVQYDNFPKESNDKYSGDIFGNLTMFESPHFLWRRFHKNYCKALALTRLQNYKLIEYEEDDEIIELSEIIDINYDLDILAKHNAIVFMVTAVEAFLKDSFIDILTNIFPEKIVNENINKIVKRYSFQNIYSINEAFNWLCNDFNLTVINENINNIFQFRHKIIHESYYNLNYSKEQFENNVASILIWINSFEYYFNENGYWDKILPKS